MMVEVGYCGLMLAEPDMSTVEIEVSAVRGLDARRSRCFRSLVVRPSSGAPVVEVGGRPNPKRKGNEARNKKIRVRTTPSFLLHPDLGFPGWRIARSRGAAADDADVMAVGTKCHAAPARGYHSRGIITFPPSVPLPPHLPPLIVHDKTLG